MNIIPKFFANQKKYKKIKYEVSNNEISYNQNLISNLFSSQTKVPTFIQRPGVIPDNKFKNENRVAEIYFRTESF